MKRRYSRAKLYGADSKWELHLKGSCLDKCTYCKKTDKGSLQALRFHPNKINYTKPSTSHTYEPDWSLTIGQDIVYIEAKGRFIDRAEYTKYIHVRNALEFNEELVFLFMNPNTPMPGAKRRKDGTIRTHAGWAEKEGFRWYSEQNINILLGDKE